MPRARGVVSPDGEARIRRILATLAPLTRAQRELRVAVVDELNGGASVRELSRLTGLSTNTISRWKKETL